MSADHQKRKLMPHFAIRWSLFALVLTIATIPVGGANTASATTLNIGTIMPLTGGAASLGKACENGLELALDQYNEFKRKSEPKITLIVEDDQAQPASAVSAFQKLITVNHVHIVLGPLTSGGTLAVAPIAEQNKVIVLSPGASAPEISNAGAYIFRVELSEALGAKEQAELAYNRLRFRKLGVLFVDNQYGLGTAQVFEKYFRQLGGKILVSEAFAPGSTDFRTALQRIKDASPQAIFVVFQDAIVNIVKQYAELGLSMPIYTTPVFENPDNLKELGNLANGIIYAYYGSFNARARDNRFIRAYRGRFRETPTYYAALGYDAMRVIILALQKASFHEDKVKDALYSIKDFPGVTGTMSFDRNGDVTKPVTLKIVRGGQFVPYHSN